jgi:hypothetical protein
MVFVELPLFSRYLAFSDEELQAIQGLILENPLRGDLIPGGRGLRKLRVPLPGRGKRGGGRVIYYLWTALDCCYLVFAYAKNVQGDLTAVQLQRLAKVVEEELDDG